MIADTVCAGSDGGYVYAVSIDARTVRIGGDRSNADGAGSSQDADVAGWMPHDEGANDDDSGRSLSHDLLGDDTQQHQGDTLQGVYLAGDSL